jgi:hypothetical protein
MTHKKCCWAGCTEDVPEKPLKGWSEVGVSIYAETNADDMVGVANASLIFCPTHTRKLLEPTVATLPGMFLSS